MKTEGKGVPAALCALALALALAVPARAAEVPGFYDVGEDQWFFPYVTELAALGGVTGYEDGSFRPGGTITRAEVCAILLGVFPVDNSVEAGAVSQAEDQAQQTNGSYWANRTIARAAACGLQDFGLSREEWSKPASRGEIAYLLKGIYTAAWPDAPGAPDPRASRLIGDYAGAVAGSRYEDAILWLYGGGMVTGVNEQGDFRPDSSATRAECCTMVVSLLHPERWRQVDWDTLPEPQPETGTDFLGKLRTRYPEDTAYDLCRALEEQIGIQIFYLPEWTPREAGLIQYETMEKITYNRAYFDAVLTELKTMKGAFDLYPEGFLREMVQKKGSRRAEIILCPYTFQGMRSFGVHVYDYSEGKDKVDQIYYTGQGDSQYYSHEMGHMVMSAAAVRSGWSTTCAEWESLSTGSGSYVSAYAATSRPEDWADTWAYLWHRTDSVAAGCSDPGLRAKVQYLSRLLDGQYDTFDASKTPWAQLLEG